MVTRVRLTKNVDMSGSLTVEENNQKKSCQRKFRFSLTSRSSNSTDI